MKHKLMFNALLELALFLTLAPIAFASTWYVNGVKGSDSNNCKLPTTACKTIGHAISLARSGDSIRVAAATYTENLTIGISLNVMGSAGSAAQATIVEGIGGTVFTISSSTANVTLSNFTIRNGGYRFSNDNGITSMGTLTISDSTISGNHSLVGGGIRNAGTLVINNSTLSGNSAFKFCYYRFPIGYVCVGGYGGAVYGGHLTINNSTISGNTATDGVGGIVGSATLQNSIVANNTGGNCAGTITSKGYNMSGDGTCNFNGPGDMNNTNPMLGSLGNNGGPTQTMALPAGSPAIDAGNPNGCTDGRGHLLKTDQRGPPRPDREDQTGCDMGAYETQSVK